LYEIELTLGSSRANKRLNTSACLCGPTPSIEPGSLGQDSTQIRIPKVRANQ
jgi:hypothetical protein